MPTLTLYVRIDNVRYFQLCYDADPAEMIPIMVNGNVVDDITFIKSTRFIAPIYRINVTLDMAIREFNRLLLIGRGIPITIGNYDVGFFEHTVHDTQLIDLV